MNEVLTIDPGLSGTGLAFWDEAQWSELVYPVRAMNIYAHSEKAWNVRAAQLAEQFELQLNLGRLAMRRVERAYIELPGVFDGTARSQASAKKGDIGKLFIVVGMLAEVLRKQAIPTEFIPVNDWVGQLPKTVNQARILARLPRLRVKAHGLDATGLGLHLKGHLNNG